MTIDDPILQAWRDATNCYLAGMGLPLLKESAGQGPAIGAQSSNGTFDPAPADPDNQPVQVGSPLWDRLAREDDDEIMDTKQDEYARKRGYGSMDELLDDPRRGQADELNRR